MTSDAPTSVLSFADVSYVRDGRPVLHDIHWTVQPGERWVVLGPNGAGKSTVLLLASTYDVRTRGTVEILGGRVGRTDLRALRRDIGYVSHRFGRDVPQDVTALEVVVTGADATLRRWRTEYPDEVWERARTLLGEVGCAPLADHRFDTLSEGERQRVLLARSVMPAPRLVLFDEPSASLDLAGREFVVAALSRLAADHAVEALICVTHHVEEIPLGFTHALLLRDGTVHQAGPIDEVLTSHHLSACFGVPVHLQRWEGRYHATAQPLPRPTRTAS